LLLTLSTFNISYQLHKSGSELAAINLDTNLAEFKKFHATRKFRAAAKAIMAVNKMAMLANTLKASAGGNDVSGKDDSVAVREDQVELQIAENALQEGASPTDPATST
jgi:hypothetical protein